jgi:hypothetical protein
MSANLTAIERIARVLAGRAASMNAKGDDPSAAPSVDEMWHDHTDDALAVLKTLREPDPVMAAAGNAQVWQTMVEAAIKAEESVRSVGFDSEH